MAKKASVRLPAEWEPQAGVQLTWPNAGGDWRGRLDWIEASLAGIAREVSLREICLIATDNVQRTADIVRRAGARMDSVRLYPIESNDIWARDHGPITVLKNGRPVILDFAFNAWGLKYPGNLDNLLTRRLAEAGAFGKTRVRTLPLVLEGGSIESDGAGTLMTTAECLLWPNRNPAYNQRQIDAQLRRYLGAERILWIRNGHIPGDDTNSHIDTLARFCSTDTIAYCGCDDPTDESYLSLRALEEELRSLRTLDGKPYRLERLPMPAPIFDAQGDRLPANYANFLIINGAVLVPSYGVPQDEQARQILAGCFPERAIVGVDSRGPVVIYGALHCVTMQIPEGALP
ncbi:MAG TPA: agmatine deiminase family protein [Candidatus Hydrogenedentes bacterium]|nr:agmatine deiminase family protein [Candidatus Hydrogenedentota bacterium]HRT19145.1 agmatine deiminase family protein [Candidatus Hydrogenedentota bacterium]HRT64074.1 agmatine deiminase family protein [Candidatus Hydrogenedentota bacterium]